MNNRLRIACSTLALLAFSTFNSQLLTAHAQGTAFTYQGRLNDNGNPANGTYDIRAGLYTTNSGGTVFAGPITNSTVVVSNGLFTIPLDYGGVFDGTIYWLQIAVRTNGGGAFTILSPRQQLTPAPYSIFAEGANAAGLSGTVPSTNLAGAYGGVIAFTNPGSSFAGNGTGLTNVNAASLGGMAAGNFWLVGGNTGVPTGSNFIGNADNQFLDVYANGVRALRLILRTDASGTFSNAPNVIGGASVNLVKTGVVGGTVGGGGGNETNGVSYPNQVNADFGAIGGGIGNANNGTGSFIGGGGYDGTTIAGNLIRDNAAVIGGGLGNSVLIGGAYSFIGGGSNNTNNGNYATVPGGFQNLATGLYSFAAGQQAQALHNGAFVWADSQNAAFASTALNQFNVRANGGVRFVTSGAGATIDGSPVLTGPGLIIQQNSADAPNMIGGSPVNFVPSGVVGATIGGGGSVFYPGESNSVTGDFGTVAGGQENTAGQDAAVGGGAGDTASGISSFVGGGFNDLASGLEAVVGGGEFNTAQADVSTVGGGVRNTNNGTGSFIGGGGWDGATAAGNTINDAAAVIGGGLENSIPIGGTYSFIGGGFGNINSGPGSVIGGGGYDGAVNLGNNIQGGAATVGGGVGNSIPIGGTYGTIGGGIGNTASGNGATVPGGAGNIASGSDSFACGTAAKAKDADSFVWSDGEGNTNFPSDRANQFKILAGGGVYMAVSGSSGLRPAALEVNSTAASSVAIYANCSAGSSNAAVVTVNTGTGDLISGFSGPNGGNHVFEVLNNGTVNAAAFNLISDRNAKEHFAPVRPSEILAKVASLPISEWNYKTAAGVTHLGPVAQDFHAAFGLNGSDDKHISTVDEGGVALAAVQGLNQKLDDRSRESEAGIRKLEAENAKLLQQNEALEKRLDNLEAIIESISNKK